MSPAIGWSRETQAGRRLRRKGRAVIAFPRDSQGRCRAGARLGWPAQVTTVPEHGHDRPQQDDRAEDQHIKFYAVHRLHGVMMTRTS